MLPDAFGLCLPVVVDGGSAEDSNDALELAPLARKPWPRRKRSYHMRTNEGLKVSPKNGLMRGKGGILVHVWPVLPTLMDAQLRIHVPLRTSVAVVMIARFARNLQLMGDATVPGLVGTQIIT